MLLVVFTIESMSNKNYYHCCDGALSPPKGDYWRMDFSRVEYQVNKVGNHYEKTSAPCDNWVWSPIGVVDMHNPDRWGMLQFSTEKPGKAKAVPNPEW